MPPLPANGPATRGRALLSAFAHMTEDDSGRDSNDFGTRLKQARIARDSVKAKRNPKLRVENSGYGQAFRMGTELLSALFVGVAIGWLLDTWLETKPWLMILFIFLGGAAGILNVYRTAMQMANEAGAAAKTGTGQSPVPDSDAKEHEN